jgi:hypothetical protein
MNVTNTMVQLMKMVADVVAADGTVTLRVVYDSIKMNMSVPMMGDVAYDSANPPPAGNPITDSLKPLGALVGQPFTMVVSPSGKVQRVDGLGPILDKARAGMAQSAGAAGMGAGDLSAVLNEASQKATLEQMFSALPEKPVKVGDSWKNAYKIPNPMGNQAVSQVYTVKEATAASALIALTGTVKAEGPPASMGPMSVTMGDGTSTGDITFDMKLGHVRKQVSTLAMPMTMAMTDGSVTIQANMKVTTTMELIEK